FEAAVALVPEKKVRNRVVGDEEICQAVVIEIRDCRAHALPDMRQEACTRRNILERTVAAVAIQAIGQTLEKTWMAIDSHATSLISAVAIRLRCPLHVVDDKEVEPSVMVVVEPGRRDCPFAAGNAGGGGDVIKVSITAVVQ